MDNSSLVSRCIRPGARLLVQGISGPRWAQNVAEDLESRGHTVGIVYHDGLRQITFLRSTVEEELAFGLEQRGWPAQRMEQRVAEVARDLLLDDLLVANPTELSGGQTRRVGMGSVVAWQPDVLIVEEPTAGLDAAACAAIARVLGEYPGAVVLTCAGYSKQLAHIAEQLQVEVLVDGPEGLASGELQTPADPVKDLEITPVQATGEPLHFGSIAGSRGADRRRWWQFRKAHNREFAVVLDDVVVQPGEVLWLRGPNGTGKSTLLRAMAGLDGHAAVMPVGLAFQRAEDQVVHATVEQMVGNEALAHDEVKHLLAEANIDLEQHPLDLAPAQLRVAQVIAQLWGGKQVVALDEPDVALSSAAEAVLHKAIAMALRSGIVLIMTCHDESFMQRVGAYARITTRSTVETSQTTP